MEQKIHSCVQRCCMLLLTAFLLLGAAQMQAKAVDGPQAFPQETLIARISRIKQLKNVKIAYEKTMVQDVTARPMDAAGKQAEELLATSLGNTNLSYVKYSDTNFAIVRKKAAASSAAPQTASSGKGTLSGTVLDKGGFPVPGATVLIAGTQNGTATDVKGQFSLTVPAKTVTVEISCISYQTMKISDVKIAAGKPTPLDVVLQDGNTELEEVVVTATYNKASANGLYAKQKARSVMSDGISADLIKKTSDNNVAQVLKRVSGVSVEDGKFVVVRGMSERYNNVQLNGTSLPSTEPNRRNFAFDIIPSSLIDNVTIAKTFTPDLPGEFTGGLVEVNTLAIPTERIIQLSVGTGMNTNSTGKDFWSNKRFGSDYLFGEIDKRKWYAGRGETSPQNIKNAEKMNTYGLGRTNAAPVQNYAFTVGLPFELRNGDKLGFVAALTYRNEQTTEELKEGVMIRRDSIFRPSYKYKFVTSTGAVANVGWESKNHKITWRNLFNSRFSHTNSERYIWISYGTIFNKNQSIEQYSTPQINRLFQTQLEGEHKLFHEKLIATWNASYNKVVRTNPDDRLAYGMIMGEDAGGNSLVNWASSVNFGGGSLNESHTMYNNLDETKKNIGGNLEYPFVVGGNKQTLKAGYMGTFRKADYEQEYLKAEGHISQGDPLYGSSVEEMFAPANFADGTLKYTVSGTGSIDFYKGDQTIHAAYLMGEFSFFRKLHLTTGFRMEDAVTEVDTEFGVYTEGKGYAIQDSLVSVRKTDWLPAVTLVYNITDNINARFAYSKTIARPDFRELTPSEYYNVDDRMYVRNHAQLRQAVADNIDLRLEWYPAPGEVISVSGFYKKFKDPVEMVAMALSSPQDFDLFPFNLDGATVKGLELNVRKSLGFLAPGSFLKDLYITGNVSVIKGDVSFDYAELRSVMTGADESQFQKQERSRPLQGLSPYTVNAGLTYQGRIFGASVNYGRDGRKFVLGGKYEKYDQYENPRDVLDVQLSARCLKGRMEIKFNAGDLLDQDIIVYRNCSYDSKRENNTEPDKSYTDRTSLGMNYNDGDWVMSRIKKGVNLSLSVSYKF